MWKKYEFAIILQKLLKLFELFIKLITFLESFICKHPFNFQFYCRYNNLKILTEAIFFKTFKNPL